MYIHDTTSLYDVISHIQSWLSQEQRIIGFANELVKWQIFEDDSTLSTASSPVITCFIFLSFQQLLAYQNNQLPQSSNVEMIIDDFIVNTEARISATSL